MYFYASGTCDVVNATQGDLRDADVLDLNLKPKFKDLNLSGSPKFWIPPKETHAKIDALHFFRVFFGRVG